MFGLRPRPNATKIAARLTKRHRDRLRDGEQIESVCEGFAADKPHPEVSGERANLNGDDKMSISGAARLRLASVAAALGVGDEGFVPLPSSRSGYLLARTNTRLLVFSGDAKTYLTESETNGIWLQAIDHGEGMFTLVFKDNDDRVAVTTRRDSAELTREFVDSFPDRRAKARVMHLAGQQALPEF